MADKSLPRYLSPCLPENPFPDPSGWRSFAPIGFDLERALAGLRGEGPKGRLDNGGATFPPLSPKEALEPKVKPPQGASRWRLKAKVARLLRPEDGSRGPAVCGCGAAGFEVEAVRVHRRDSGAGASGVYRCDSPWLCPTCAPARAKDRQERVAEVIEAAMAGGGGCAFVTLTIRHDLSLKLARAKRILSTASRKARQGRRWLAIKEQGGILGVVQGVEVLHSRIHGWHYHAHLIIPGTGGDSALLEAAQALVARYIEEVRAQGASALLEGQDVQIVRDGEAAEYASKGSASWEVAGGAKQARSAKSRTPWDLVTLAALGDEEARALFAEYAQVMPGTRSCVVSAALAKALDLPEDADDDEPGEQQLEEHDQVVGEVAAPIWNRLLLRGHVAQIFRQVEAGEEWPVILEVAKRLGAEDPPKPKPKEKLDVRRAVMQARCQSTGKSSAARSAHLESAIQEQRAQAARWGREVEIDMAAVQAEFIRQGLQAAL